MSSEQIAQLKGFVGSLQADPKILHVPDLKFFKDYIESLGGRIPDVKVSSPSSEAPPKASPTEEKTQESKEDDTIPDFVEEEMDTSQLVCDGVIEPETEPCPEILEGGKEVSEDAMEKANSLRSEAMAQMSEGNFAEAVDKFTEAIKLNPDSAVFYAKRAQALLKQNRVKAVIADCDEAIKRNPDSALAHKLRGRAYRLLGEWIHAAQDLRKACKLDCDEQAMEWLKEVQGNASKIEQHRQTQERRRAEHELQQRKQRVARAREEAKKRAEEEEKNRPSFGGMPGGMPGGMGGMPGFGGMPGGMGGMPGMPGGMGGMPGGMGGMPGMPGGMDADMLKDLSDPEVSAALQDIMSNPMNIMKYKDNPKVARLIAKMKAGFGGGAEAPPTECPSGAPPKGPTPPEDDLD